MNTVARGNGYAFFYIMPGILSELWVSVCVAETGIKSVFEWNLSVWMCNLDSQRISISAQHRITIRPTISKICFNLFCSIRNQWLSEWVQGNCDRHIRQIKTSTIHTAFFPTTRKSSGKEKVEREREVGSLLLELNFTQIKRNRSILCVQSHVCVWFAFVGLSYHRDWCVSVRFSFLID